LIKSFKHKGLQAFFQTGTTSGIQAAHSAKLRLILQDQWSLTVNGNWRVIFKFEDGDVYVVDYLDYH